MVKKLTDEQQVTLQNWLTNKNIKTNKLARDFSDATLTASIIKKIVPKIIDVNNYPVENNTQKKRANWETLNLKVLGKMGLSMKKADMEKLATATPGAIDSFLYDLMKYEEAIAAKQPEKDMNVQQRDEENKKVEQNPEDQEIKKDKKIKLDKENKDDEECKGDKKDEVVDFKKKKPDAAVHVPQQMISMKKYEKMLRKFKESDAQCKIAMQRVDELKEIIKFKEERLKNLDDELKRAYSTSDVDDPQI